MQNDEVIKGVILEDNEIVGIISGKQEFKEAEKKPVAEGELSHEDDRRDEGWPESQLQTTIPFHYYEHANFG